MRPKSFNALQVKVATMRRKNYCGLLDWWLTGKEVFCQLRISLRTLRNKRIVGKPQALLQIGRVPESDSAYQHALSRQLIGLLFTH